MSRALGVAASLGAGLCLSSGGIALRLVEAADGWQILFYRGIALAVSIFVWLGLRYRGQLPAVLGALGLPGVLAAVAIGTAAILYVFAILNTTVANVVVILSISPLLVALVARLVLAERVAASTLLAAGVALVGIALMFADGLRLGGTLGILTALGAAGCFTLFIVTLRAQRDLDMIPAIGLSGLVTVAIAAPMATDLIVSLHDLAIGLFLGAFQLALGYGCIAVATRHLPAARVSLLLLSEVILAPFWVWLGNGETPSAFAALGAAIVLGAVAWQTLHRES